MLSTSYSSMPFGVFTSTSSMDCQLFVFLCPFEEHFNRFPNRAGYLIFSYRRVPARQDKRHLLDVLRTRRQKSLFLDLLSSPIIA